MNLFDPSSGEVGDVLVQTTSGRGHTPEEIADRAVDRIIYIGTNAHPALQEQAVAYKGAIRDVLVLYMKEAIMSHNTTLAKRLKDAGHPELVSLLRP